MSIQEDVPKTRTYILLGGGGFIGKGLRNLLAQMGEEVVIIGRALHIPHLSSETYYSLKEYSLAGLREKMAAARDYIIIDLAYTSVPNSSFDDPVKDFSENLYNVILYLNFARDLNAKKYIYVSSGGTVYGNGFSYAIPETAPNFPIAPYGITKLACERYVHMYHEVHQLPAIIVRPSNVFGPGQVPFRGQGFIATATGLAVQGEPVQVFGDGNIVRDYLYIDDFSAAVLDVIRHGHNGSIYNIGSETSRTIREVIACINSIIAEDHIQLGTRDLPARTYDVPFNVLDCSALKALNGWRPQTTFEQGLRSTWKWIQQYHEASH